MVVAVCISTCTHVPMYMYVCMYVLCASTCTVCICSRKCICISVIRWSFCPPGMQDASGTMSCILCATRVSCKGIHAVSARAHSINLVAPRASGPSFAASFSLRECWFLRFAVAPFCV